MLGPSIPTYVYATLTPHTEVDSKIKTYNVPVSRVYDKDASTACGFRSIGGSRVKVLILGEIDVGKFVRYPLKHVTAPVCLKA